MIKCVFFDRDGVINERIVDDYVKKESDFKLNNDILPLLKYCDENNFLKIIITNQQGIGKGLMSEKDLSIIHKYMNNLLIENSIKEFDEIYYATELASVQPKRRKPSPEMLFEAMDKYNLKSEECVLIGDSKTDIQAGNNAKIKSIFYSEVVYENAVVSTKNIIKIIDFISKL